MRTDHAHVESAILAACLVAILALLDLFVDMKDGHSAKILCYFGLFFILYLFIRIFRKREWQ